MISGSRWAILSRPFSQKEITGRTPERQEYLLLEVSPAENAACRAPKNIFSQYLCGKKQTVNLQNIPSFLKKQASERSLLFLRQFFGNPQENRLIFPLNLRCPVAGLPKISVGCRKSKYPLRHACKKKRPHGREGVSHTQGREVPGSDIHMFPFDADFRLDPGGRHPDFRRRSIRSGRIRAPARAQSKTHPQT
jgi:hypothetical protein